MTAKVEVKDAGLSHPFYAWAEAKLWPAAVPVWNFHKILIGKDGEVIAAFGPPDRAEGSGDRAGRRRCDLAAARKPTETRRKSGRFLTRTRMVCAR